MVEVLSSTTARSVFGRTGLQSRPCIFKGRGRDWRPVLRKTDSPSAHFFNRSSASPSPCCHPTRPSCPDNGPTDCRSRRSEIAAAAEIERLAHLEVLHDHADEPAFAVGGAGRADVVAPFAQLPRATRRQFVVLVGRDHRLRRLPTAVGEHRHVAGHRSLHGEELFRPVERRQIATEPVAHMGDKELVLERDPVSLITVRFFERQILRGQDVEPQRSEATCVVRLLANR